MSRSGLFCDRKSTMRFGMTALPRRDVRQHERLYVIAQALQRTQQRPQVCHRRAIQFADLIGDADDLIQVTPDHPELGDRALELMQLAIGERRYCT